MTRNTPNFADSVASCVGTRDWYTRARPTARGNARHTLYSRPAMWQALKRDFVRMYGEEAI